MTNNIKALKTLKALIPTTEDHWMTSPFFIHQLICEGRGIYASSPATLSEVKLKPAKWHGHNTEKQTVKVLKWSVSK